MIRLSIASLITEFTLQRTWTMATTCNLLCSDTGPDTHLLIFPRVASTGANLVNDPFVFEVVVTSLDDGSLVVLPCDVHLCYYLQRSFIDTCWHRSWS